MFVSEEELKTIRDAITQPGDQIERDGAALLTKALELVDQKLAQEQAVASKVDYALDPDRRLMFVKMPFAEPIAIHFAHLKLALAQILRQELSDAEQQGLLDNEAGKFTARQEIRMIETLETDAAEEVKYGAYLRLTDIAKGNGATPKSVPGFDA